MSENQKLIKSVDSKRFRVSMYQNKNNSFTVKGENLITEVPYESEECDFVMGNFIFDSLVKKHEGH